MSELAVEDCPAAARSAESVASTADGETAPAPSSASSDADLVLEDLLVEDVSIDGMCGVY
jgi:mycofactocin precursor